MSPSPWHLERHLAQLRIGPLSAGLDLLRPAAGLANWHGLGDTPSALRILAVEPPTYRAGDPGGLVEAYLRGPDLIAIYRESSDWPVLLHGLWRALTAEDPAEFVAAVELTLSVRTERLDVRPELSVCGRLPAGEVSWLLDPDAARFEPCKPPGGRPAAVGSAQPPACVLFRPRRSEWSYAEMAHPADLGGSELAQDDAADGQVVLRHRLFARRLEKGVLLRTRVRGLFLQRQNDALIAAAEYRAFACADPPLGT